MIQIGKYNFDGPWFLSSTNLIDRAAVYAILCSRADGKYDVVLLEKLVKPEPDYQTMNEPPVGVEIAGVLYTLRFSGLPPTDIQQMIAVISRRN